MYNYKNKVKAKINFGRIFWSVFLALALGFTLNFAYTHHEDRLLGYENIDNFSIYNQSLNNKQGFDTPALRKS